MTSPPGEKVRLFCSLFKGRRDVFAQWYESASTGRSGYSPMCRNRWWRLLCDAKRTPCAVCPNSRFAELTEGVVSAHLLGRDARGRPFSAAIYPITPDERVHLCTVSIHGAHWREDAAAVHEAAMSLGAPCLMERTGEGIQIWFLFEKLVEARLARDFATSVLFEAYMRRPEIGLGVFDEISPPQDTIPRDRIGPFIPLPLRRDARGRRLSVFVDGGMSPYSDQWAALSGAGKVADGVVAAVTGRAAGLLRALETMRGSGDGQCGIAFLATVGRIALDKAAASSQTALPDAFVKARLDNRLRITIEALPPRLVAELSLLASFANPQFLDAQRMRLPVTGVPRIVSRAEIAVDVISLPRGCLDGAMRLLGEHGIGLDVDDARFPGRGIDVSFHGELRPEQRAAASAILRHDFGILAAGTAFGKTVLAAYVIAARKVSTLVIVNRRQLQMQWVARLATFLGVEEKSIGRIGGGAMRATGAIDVAVVQSLSRKGELRALADEYGQVIVDECHALPAPTFEAVVDAMRPKFILGLSATVERRDGHHPLIALQCGPVRHRADGRRATALEPFDHVVVVRPTPFTPSSRAADSDGRVAMSSLVGEIAADAARNSRITADVLEAVSAGRSPVVLSGLRAHLDVLAEALAGKVENVIILRGGMGKREAKRLRERLDALPDTAPRVLLATGPYLGEGFDDSRLDTLFLATPVSWRGRIVQYVGRLHRRHAGKRVVKVYDYVDVDVPVCRRMFDRRCAGYDALGYRIELPLPATPGWPEGVAVPLDGGWQETYGASVKRLCADGVDAALASLFVVGAKTIIDDGEEGEGRARSAAEAFLYRRLETLPQTHGLFVLNEKLPVAFGEEEFMEPDLLSGELGIVVEIDGAQHLGSADAYRRDRRKDMMLQERGYLVMRFLYDDVFSALASVQSQILRAVARRRGDIEQAAENRPAASVCPEAGLPRALPAS